MATTRCINWLGLNSNSSAKVAYATSPAPKSLTTYKCLCQTEKASEPRCPVGQWMRWEMTGTELIQWNPSSHETSKDAYGKCKPEVRKGCQQGSLNFSFDLQQSVDAQNKSAGRCQNVHIQPRTHTGLNVTWRHCHPGITSVIKT